MSQLTATARALRRPARTSWSGGSAGRLAPRATRVSVAPVKAGSLTFAVLCVALLSAGLTVVLLLNTSMARGAFELAGLQNTSTTLGDEQATLQGQLDRAGSSGSLMRQATALGMVPSTSSGYVRIPDGRVLGVASPARRTLSPTVMASAARAGLVARNASVLNSAGLKPTPPRPGKTKGTKGTATR